MGHVLIKFIKYCYKKGFKLVHEAQFQEYYFQFCQKDLSK